MNRFPPIAIVGRACVLPGVSSPDELWEAVVTGTDLVTSVPGDRWGIAADDVMCEGPDQSVDRTWSDRGGYVHSFDKLFDPDGFALSANEVLALDPVFQWTLHTAREALRDAGHADADPARFGAVFGNLSFPSAGMAAFSQAVSLSTLAGYETAVAGPLPNPLNRFTSGLPALVLERALGLGVGAFALDAACASSLYAIKLACDRLHDDSADLMLAGAVNCADDLCIHLGFTALRALSRTGRSRPFHRDADGLVPAEGCGFVALRRLDDALRDGDTIHGIIRGIGLSNDGRGKGMLVPSHDGQTRAMRGALTMAGLSPDDVSLLECHATGTQVGDAVEVRSSAAVYADLTDMPIGSLKSNTGHLIAAAGVAGLIKVLEAMRHEVLPPTLHVDEPLDVIAESPFRLLGRAEVWDRGCTSDGVLRAGVSAFGFGGNNAHLIVEEPGVGRSPETAPQRGEPRALPATIAIVGLGIVAASAVGRVAFAEALISETPCLDGHDQGRLADIALRLDQQKFPPNDLRATLAQQLAMLQVADEALRESGPVPFGTTGVYVGMGADPEAARFGMRWRIATLARQWGCPPGWIQQARDLIGPVLDAARVLGTMPNVVANRLNSQYDIAGPSFTISAEEHSGLEALALATRALRVGEIDAALVGAVDMSCDSVHQVAMGMVGPADRQTPGDAAVMMVLKRLEDAERDGNTIYAVLPGGRFHNDGEPQPDRPDVVFGLGNGPGGEARSVTHLFGHSHAASGLVHVAAAALALHHRVVPGDTPLLASNPGDGTGLAAGAGPRTALVRIAAIDGIVPRSVLLAEAAGKPAPSRVQPPRLHVFSAPTMAELVDGLVAGRESGQESRTGPARLVIVATSDQQFAERSARARRHIETGHPPGEGVHVRSTPVGGEIAFVFTGAGAAYRGMGEELLRAIPELASPISANFPLGDVAGWAHAAQPSDLHPSDYLWGTALLTQVHAQLTRHLLQIVPNAAIGYSSGESNSLYAFGVWTDMDAMRAEIEASGMMERELGGRFAAVRRAWGQDSARWAVWNVLAPVDEVRRAIAAEARVHLAIVNTANDVVIAGDAAVCDLVVDAIGRRRCRVVDYNLACHVPEVAQAFHEPWLRIHTRAVTPVPGVRFYSNGASGSYNVTSQACAEAITAQAETTLDFRGTIEAAYADGVRVFVEHGPGGACTNFIREILRDRDIVCVQLDRRGKDITQVYEVIAALVAAGVAVNHQALTERLQRPAARPTIGGPVLRVPAHPEPIRLPPRETPVQLPVQMMAPAPWLPSVFFVAPAPQPATDVHGGVVATVHQQLATTTALHRTYVEHQSVVHELFLTMRSSAMSQLASSAALIAPVAPVAPLTLVDPIAARPLWNKQQLQIHSSGRISELFGPFFEPQDGYEHQCRMPEPPLLLADRVTGMVAEPGVLGRGTIWTETDVQRGAWYLNGGYMPAGFMIESGQADLMLISYMGIDLLNRGERVYRLLGCTLTYHGDLPSPGETLQYEIRVNSHARHGDIRLFFFEYDCVVAGRRRLTVRDGQAGFFNRSELNDALGVLWTPQDGQADLAPDARVDPPAVSCTKTSFSRDDVVAFSEGRVLDCFGAGYGLAETHTRTPKIQSGQQLFIDEVTAFDPVGGPWGRGLMRCEAAIANDAWFFDGHFKNDPCMPGNFMVEACIEAMSFYLAALGHTVQRDGWRFQPLPEQPFELKCRGEINPQTQRVVYELHVEEIWSGPHPTIICDVVGFVDGKAAFHAHRIGVELTPGWPLTSMPELYEGRELHEGTVEPVEVATDGAGFAFDWKAMISCAWGRPSEAFGPMYEMFDGTRRSPRLPGPPYHFISRVTKIDGTLGDCTAGMEMVCEYDIPDDAWYFDQNGAETMPFAVLLEAALQPCGWVASAVGSVAATADDLLFRNLDGTGTLVGELTRPAATATVMLTTRVKLVSVSRAGGMIIEGFDVECALGDRLSRGVVIYKMNTVFGFFPPDAFENQVGLAVDTVHRDQISQADPAWIDLTDRPARYCAGQPRLAGPMLLMLDRVAHIAGAGSAGLGVVRGEKDVDVSEWFFKAHFFQDAVQPGSLGIEALLQLLQFYMLDKNMAAGLPDARFEPIMLGTPLTWKYRGQVTPRNTMITTVMEITAVGADDHGPFVIGAGSLWCDGLRIYEVSGMGMRIVGGHSGPGERTAGEVAKRDVVNAMHTFWGPLRNTPQAWLGDDLIDGLIDRYVNRVMVPVPATLDNLRARSAIFVANHQVQIESLIMSNVLPALTGVPLTVVANAKHEQRWIGELVRALEAYPGFRARDVIAYFDQAQPATMFEIIAGVRERMAAGPHSFFVHVDGTRARSCRQRTLRCSSVLLDLALELDVPIVPVRFTGGLPIEPIAGKAEVPVGHGRQDYWIGAPIEADELRSIRLRDRVDHVVSSINSLGVTPEDEVPLDGDPVFAARVRQWQQRTGGNEVFAAAWQILQQADDVHDEAQILRDAAAAGTYRPDGTPRGEWLGGMAALLLGAGSVGVGSERQAFTVGRSSHPHLVDHSVNGTPVVPVACVLEWFARAAIAHAPDLYLAELFDLRVLKGVVADGYAAGDDLRLLVTSRAMATPAQTDAVIGESTLALELIDESTGGLHYRCFARLTVDPPVATTSTTQVADAAAALTRPVYGSGVLFHGPAFQVIAAIDTPSASGLVASLTGVLEHEWPAEAWVGDVALLDGALQLALLWTEHLLDEPSLPTGIGRVRTFGPPRHGRHTATLVGREASRHRVVCDVVVRDESGTTVVAVRGIETHVLPKARSR